MNFHSFQLIIAYIESIVNMQMINRLSGIFRRQSNYNKQKEILIRYQMSTQSGKIELIYGPMFSGKTSEMIRRVKRHQHAQKKCLIVNYAKDNRYSDQ